MENNIAMNNAVVAGENFYGSGIPGDKIVSNPATANMAAGTDTNFSGSLNAVVLFREIFSVFHSLGFAIKVLVIFAFSSVYFVIGSLVALIYLIFYVKLFKTIFRTPRKRNHKSPYYYKWKNHHLELNYEA